jgi:hypothetical protein
MLRRPEGATVAQIAKGTGWAQHTAGGFFAGLKREGHAVEGWSGCARSAPTRRVRGVPARSTGPPAEATR